MSGVISVLSRWPAVFTELQKVLPKLSFHLVQNPETDEQLKKSEIIISDYDLIGPHIYKLPNVKWMQGTWAGIEFLLKHVKLDTPPPFPITRFSGRHFGTLMSEYVIAHIINIEREFFTIRANQKLGKWVREGTMVEHRTISRLKIGILGLGSIGSRLAHNFHFLGATVSAFGRKPTLDNEHITNYYHGTGLAEFLRSNDYFVNVLPSTDETRGLLNGNVLESCKERQVIFINIGRGSIISEECLINALNRKWLAGAVLDVYEIEPLPEGSPLWKMPNVYLTPHISGVSQPRDIAEQFKDNLKFYTQNLPIPATIDFSKGY